MKLLHRQLRRLGLSADTPPTADQWRQLLATVERTYDDADQDRYLLERSLSISTREMRALHDDLREQSASALARERDKLAKLVEEIETASERGASLTSQLLAFRRKQRRQVSSVDVNAVVLTIDRLLSRVIGEHIEITMQLDGSLGTVEADTSQLEQVVMNLIINARDAMPAGGRLVVETTNTELDDHTAPPLGLAPGRYVVLAVSDTGVGMDAETRAHIFEPFFTTKEVGRGTGLGLATVFGIVRQSEGAVSVHSELGRGSTFRVYLPHTGEVQPARSATGNISRQALRRALRS